MLDHKKTARELEGNVRVLSYIRANICDTSAHKKAVKEIIDHLYGLADWHLSLAGDTQALSKP